MKKIFILIIALFFMSGCAIKTDKNLSGVTLQTVTTTDEQKLPDAADYPYDEASVQNFINKECTKDDSNVYSTECAIELLDKKAAEREWKQRKLESIKEPEINVYDLTGDLKEWQTKIFNWRKNFEKMRDAWCDAKYSFIIGSGIPYTMATCELDIEMRAINDLNYIYYNTIMTDVGSSEGIADFEPTPADIDKLTKTNITKRGCVWAGEDEPNCVSPIEIH